MKYKFSRKLLSKAYGGYDNDKDFIEDLLATLSPDKESLNEMEGRVLKIIKNWQKNYYAYQQTIKITPSPEKECNCNYPDLIGMNCPIHGMKQDNSTPSPLEFEEIEEFEGIKTPEGYKTVFPREWYKLNQLIRNQRLLIKQLKRK